MAEEKQRLPRTDLKGYFQGISQRLDVQASLMTPVIVHSGEMGDNDHGWFSDFLRQYLPQRIGIDTGFVVNCDSDKGSAEFFAANGGARTQDKNIGPQSDILVLDVLNNAPFCVEKSFRVCPVEMVLATIEVTRKLTMSKLHDDCDKIGRVREMSERKRFSHFDHENPEGRELYGFLVAFESDIEEKTLIDTIQKLAPNRRPVAVLIVNKALYTWFGEKQFILPDASLFKFLALVRRLVEGLPLGSTDLYTYLPPMAHIYDASKK